MIRRSVLWIAVVCVAASAFGAGAGEPEPEINLLQETPNYAKVLADQWSGKDVPSNVELYPGGLEHYGLLRETAKSRSLTLEEAIAMALANNTNLKIQRLGPLAAREQVRSSQAIFDPTLYGDFSYDRAAQLSSSYLRPEGTGVPASLVGTLALLGPPVNSAHNINVDGGVRKTLLSGGQLSLSWRNNRLTTNSSFTRLSPQYTTNFILSLNQPLLRDFGWRFSTLLVRVARNAREQSIYQYEAQVASIILQVEQAYWNLVQAIENIRVQEKGLAASRELQRQNEGKYNVGTLPQTAVLEARADVARLDANLIQAHTAQELARDNLRALLNYREPGTNALVMIDPADEPKVVPYDVDLERSLSTALQSRPELIAAQLAIKGSGMMLKVAENQLLPRLNAVGTLGTNGLSGGRVVTQTTDATTGEVTTLVNPYNGPYEDSLNRSFDGRYYSYSAGVTLEIPIGNAQAKADYARSRIDLESSQRQLQQEQESVTLEVKSAVTSLLSDLKSIEATRIARQLAEENVRNQQARYDVGLATTKDLLDFQNQLTQAQAAEVQSLTGYNVDLARLRLAEGTLLESRNVVVDKGEDVPTPWWAHF